MYPMAGAIIWIVLGTIVGLLAGKVAGREGPNHTMTNLGIAVTSAVVAGGIVTFASAGAQSTSAFVIAIVVAAIAAVMSVSLYRLVHRGRSSTIR